MFAVITILFTINITIISVVFTNISAFLVPCFTAAFELVNNMIKKFNHKDQKALQNEFQLPNLEKKDDDLKPSIGEYLGTKKDMDRTTSL